MLFLASSCLQGTKLSEACFSLLRLKPQGIQLCPGHHPSPGIQQLLHSIADLKLSLHHGFSWNSYRQQVWENGKLLSGMEKSSVHPPEEIGISNTEWLRTQVNEKTVIEIMPPGKVLGTGKELELAMDLGLQLAVDIAHLFIQKTQGVTQEKTIRRLFDYDNIVEVHASDSDGRFDLHRPLRADSFGLDWAKERNQSGMPVVLECYMHKLNSMERQTQMEFFQ